MSFRDTVSPPPDQTAASPGSGCLSGFLLPPLVVVLVGLIMGFLLRDVNPAIPTPGTPRLQPGAGDGPTGSTLASLFTAEVRYWAGSIQVWSDQAGLDPNLVATVMQIESCGNPVARSRAGALGLFQVMPDHFLVTDLPTDPQTNALRGLAYLKRSLNAASGDARLALAGYNGGISVVARDETSWAAETQRYAYWGSGIYADAENGATESLRLEQWLAAGGSSLCRQARQILGITP
jgi:hypothetical protein